MNYNKKRKLLFSFLISLNFESFNVMPFVILNAIRCKFKQ